MCKILNICECPESLSLDDLPIKPMLHTPLDQLGFPNKCCWCIPLRCAAILICMISFFWIAYELQAADKFIGSLIPSRNNVFYYCKMFYLLWCICFMVACGILMLGIIVKRHQLLNIYIWAAFVFCCSYIIITLTGAIIHVLRSGNMDKKMTVSIVWTVVWGCLFFYFIIVVNSYKVTVW